MNRKLQIFISSKMEELAPERAAVKSALSEMQIDPFVFETDAGARPNSIRTTYLRQLDEADLYIGIFWKGYGKYTIDEFDHARAKGKDCLIYEKREGIDGSRDPALQEFLDRIGQVEGEVTIRWFWRPEELAGFIKQDVAGWQTDIVRRARLPRVATPFQAPPQSDRYVDRVQLHSSLKTAVLPLKPGDRPSLTRAILHGIGGSGKTSVATAFAHDSDVRRAFPDGVLWVSLGQTPNLLQLQSVWGRALEDPKAANLGYPDSQTSESQLRTLLSDRACLLIVDDAWKGDDVESAFLVGGPKCLLLVTTRQAEIAKMLDAPVFELEGMAEAEALALFERWSGSLAETDSETARWLAKQVDYLPLALELIGAQVGRVNGWSEYRTRWEAQRLASLKRGRRASGSKDNLLDSLELSVNALPEADRIAYLQTAAFPPGSAFPASAAAALWDMPEFDAAELLLDLADQALVSRREQKGKTWFGFHALLQDYVVAASGTDGVVRAHQSVIAGYRKQWPNGWATATDDGYLFNNLSYHLVAAGETAELYALVDRSWMEAQFARSESHRPFAQDVERALEAADRERPRNWTMVAHCRHVIASLHAQAAEMSIEMLEVLGRTGRISRALEAAALLADSWRRSRAYLKLSQVMIEQGALDDAAAAVRLSVEATEGDRERLGPFAAQALAAAAEEILRCGKQAEAENLLRRADVELQSDPKLENRCSYWIKLARARLAVEGTAAALRAAWACLEETEAASGDEAQYAVPELAKIVSGLGAIESEFLDRLLKAALYLRQQGRSERALSETIVAISACGNLAQACDLLPKVSEDSTYIKAATACAEAAHKGGDLATTARILSKLYAWVERVAQKDGRIDTDYLIPLRKLVVQVDGHAGLERLATSLTALKDPIWRSLASGQLAVAAAEVGDAKAAADHAGEAARVLSDALKAGRLQGETVRTNTAISLVEAGHLDSAMNIVNGISDPALHHEALCQVALKLLQQGDSQKAETVVEQVLSATAVRASADPSEITAACLAAETLWGMGAAEPARDILEATQDRVPMVTYDSSIGAAYGRLAEAFAVIGEHSKARDAVRKAFPLFTTGFWEDSGAVRCFELACRLYDDTELDGLLATLSDDWSRRSYALPGVVKGLVARGQTERAQKYYDEVRQGESDYTPWHEVGKAESLVELAKLDDEKLLEWMQDGGGLFAPDLRGLMLGHEAAAWIRLKQLVRAETTLQHALASCTEISDDNARQQKLAEIGKEMAAAGAPDLALRAAEDITAGTARDDSLRSIALALVKTPQFADAGRVVEHIEDSERRDRIFLEVAEQLADAGEYDSALACVRRTLSESWTQYIAATAAHKLAIAGRRDEARAILQDLDTGSVAGDPNFNDLVLARQAQAQALLGDFAAANASATAALELAYISKGAFVWAWCADALAQLGDMDRAAKAAEKALESVQDFDNEWDQAVQLEMAAAALAKAKTIDRDRILTLVRGLENEFARADALGKVYPHLRSVTPDAGKELSAVIGEMKEDWAQAQAVALLADPMGRSGDRESLHELLPIAETIDNKWAAAHAVGQLASGLAIGGDPDDLTQALRSITGYNFSLPGWRRAAAVGMAALALRRIGKLDRASDLADEALKLVVFQEDIELGKRGRQALRSASAALVLGERPEAERQADIAQTSAARISRGRFSRHEFIEPLFNLASELGSPERIERALELCRDNEDPALLLRAESDAGIRLARMGHRSEALAHTAIAVAGVDSYNADTAGLVHADAAAVAHICGDAERASDHFSAALRIPGSREVLASVLEVNVDFLKSIDQGPPWHACSKGSARLMPGGDREKRSWHCPNRASEPDHTTSPCLAR